MKKIKTSIVFIAAFLIAAASAQAQFIEDALRYTQSNAMISPRAGGLNVAYHGMADDFSTLYFNPAGLSSIPKSEINFGFGFKRNNTSTEFFKNVKEFNSNDAYVSHAGIVAPFETEKGNAAIAIGYVMEDNFDNHSKYSAFNPFSSYTNYQANLRRGNYDDNLAYQLYLADYDFNTPLEDSLNQAASINEAGGIHAITGGAGFDLSKYVSLGFSITGKWGGYDFTRNFVEADSKNLYSSFDTTSTGAYDDIDFNRLEVDDVLQQSISGITGSIGIQTRLEKYLKFGVTIQFPTFYSIEEDWSRTAVAYFDNGEVTPEFEETGQTAYNLTTPWLYSAGFSVHALGLTFAAGVEYSDVTQLNFSDASDDAENDALNSHLSNLNAQIVEELVGQVEWGFGLEYEIPLTPIVARASFASRTSPYSEDIPGAAINNFSIGGGIYLAPNIRLDGIFRYTDYSQLRTIYGNENKTRYIVDKSPLDIGLQLTYRY